MTPQTPGSDLFDTVVDRRGSDSLKWAKYAGRRAADGSDILPLWVADMDFAAPPAVVAALHARVAHGVFGYGHATPAFLAAVTAALARDYGWNVAPEWIVPLPGLVPGLNIAARCLGAPGDALITATPVYPPFFSAPVHMQRRCVRVPLREQAGWAWDLDALEAACTPRTRGLFLCHPHNPVGRVWTAAELEGLAAFAARHDLVVVSDEAHCELILERGLTHRPFALHAPPLAHRTITLMAPSKTYNLPGLGCAFAVIADARLRRRFTQAAAGIVPAPNVLGLVAATAAYAQGQDWRAALLDYLRDNRERVMTLDGVGGLRVQRPQATYLAWLDCRALPVPDPARWFEDAGVGLSDGRDFGAPGFVRLNFGCPRATLDEALARLRRAALAAGTTPSPPATPA